MATEMAIPDYHNQRRLPTNSTISLWEDRAVLYNENNMEKSEDGERDKASQTISRRQYGPEEKQCWRDKKQRKAVQTCQQCLNCLCTIMFLHGFNNVCIDGVIQQ